MKRILAIDDKKDNLTTINAVLKVNIPNCEVLLALSGKEGIEIAKNEQIDIILLDIIMPNMDGYEVCKKLKEDESTKHIPVLMLTAIKTDSESRVKGLNIGADAFLSKPIDSIELSAQVNVLLRIKESEDRLRAEKKLLDKTVKERTNELRKSEEKYRTLIDDVLDTSTIGVIILDSDFKIVWINCSTEKYFGIKRNDVIEKDKRQLILSKIKNIFEEPEIYCKRLLNTYDDNTYVENFVCHVLPDGNRKERWLKHWSQPIETGLYKGGRIEHYTDITESKKIANALIESEERFKNFSNLSFEGILIHKNGVTIDTNESLIKMFGYTRNEVIGRNVIELCALPEYYDVIKENIVKNRTEPYEIVGRKKSGMLFPVELEARDIIRKNEKIRVVALRDITKRKQAENELKMHRNHLEELVEERTKELEEKNKKLKHFNNLFEGREFRIRDLKEKVKELEEQLRIRGD